MECGLIGNGELVRSHRQASPLLQPVDASLDSVALLVYLSIETRRAPSCAASPEAVSDLAGGQRNDGTDATTTEVPVDRAGRVRAIRENSLWSSPRSPDCAPGYPDPRHDRLKGRCVTGLACGDVEAQRSRLAVTGKVNFRAQATT